MCMTDQAGRIVSPVLPVFGMARMVVTPPARAAAVQLAQSSLWVIPGGFTSNVLGNHADFLFNPAKIN